MWKDRSVNLALGRLGQDSDFQDSLGYNSLIFQTLSQHTPAHTASPNYCIKNFPEQTFNHVLDSFMSTLQAGR